MQRIINRIFLVFLIVFLAGYLFFDWRRLLSSVAPTKSLFETAESTGSLIGMLLFLTGLVSAVLSLPAARRTLLGGSYPGLVIVGAIGMIVFGKLGAMIGAAF